MMSSQAKPFLLRYMMTVALKRLLRTNTNPNVLTKGKDLPDAVVGLMRAACSSAQTGQHLSYLVFTNCKEKGLNISNHIKTSQSYVSC